MTDAPDELDVDRSGGLSDTEAFALLGDPTRLRILVALGDAVENGEPYALSFSELRRRAGVEGSGRFNYHLEKLVDVFVSRADDGYNLLFPGVIVYNAFKAGTFTDRPTIEPFSLDAACFDCGAPLAASYDDHLFTVACPECGLTCTRYQLPPGGTHDASPDQLLAAVNERVRADLRSINHGVCANCGGPLDRRFVSSGPEEERARIRGDAVLLPVCEACDWFVHAHVGSTLLSHPALVSFFHERGVDLSTTYLWELEFAATDNHTRVVSEDPWRFEVTASCGGDELALVVDGDLDVRETRRVS